MTAATTRPPLSAERARELLAYSPDTGVLTRRVRRAQCPAGSVAGCIVNGYRRIFIDGRSYAAHRVAWLIVHGMFPASQLDHVSGDRDDNRLVNLREVTAGENGQNVSAARTRNTTGLLGVSRNGRGFQARITLDGARICLGTYPTPEAAYVLYLIAKHKLHSHRPGLRAMLAPIEHTIDWSQAPALS